MVFSWSLYCNCVIYCDFSGFVVFNFNRMHCIMYIIYCVYMRGDLYLYYIVVKWIYYIKWIYCHAVICRYTISIFWNNISFFQYAISKIKILKWKLYYIHFSNPTSDFGRKKTATIFNLNLKYHFTENFNSFRFFFIVLYYFPFLFIFPHFTPL